MDGFWWAFVVSTAVVFIAELGDKSQLMALTFATRFRALPVLVGITLATSLVHLISVAVGHSLGSALPTGWIALVAAIAFIGFGAWTLRGDSLSEDESAKAARVRGSAIMAVFVAFFLAELGDKTMLATITLATQHGWLGVWVGSTLGMVAADAVAIVVGRQLGMWLPERVVQLGAASLFFLFGVWIGFEAVGELTGVPAWTAIGDVLDHHAAGWIALGIGLAATVAAMAAVAADRRIRRGGPRSVGAPVLWARVLFTLSAVLGLVAPLLVGADVVDPIALFDDPGLVVIGAGLALLGVALVLAAQAAAGDPAGPVLATSGLHARVRNPGLTGMVVATAGTLVMVPTLLAVLAAVLLVVAVQIQVRAVREPTLARLHGEGYTEYAARTGRFLPRMRLTGPDAPGTPGGEHVRVG